MIYWYPYAYFEMQFAILIERDYTKTTYTQYVCVREKSKTSNRLSEVLKKPFLDKGLLLRQKSPASHH